MLRTLFLANRADAYLMLPHSVGSNGLYFGGHNTKDDAFLRDYTGTPPNGTPPDFRTLLGLISPVLISSLNPAGVPLRRGVLL